MSKRKDECYFCKKRKCNHRIVSSDDLGKTFDEVSCDGHVRALERHSDIKAPGIMKLYISSTGQLKRGDMSPFKRIKGEK